MAAPSHTTTCRRRSHDKADVAFFAGCMTHLTPSVVRSMIAIFEEAGVKLHLCR
jgi:Fe-S oxidoreductase